MLRERSLLVVTICSIVTLTTALLQYLYPRYAFLDGGYVAAIVLTVFSHKKLPTQIFGILAFVFIFISLFYQPVAVKREEIIARHLFFGVIVTLTALSILYIKRLYDSIRFEQQQVVALIEHTTEGIILANQQGEIILINPSALALFGYQQFQLLGRKIETLLPERFRAQHVQYREHFIQNPATRSMGHGRDLFALHKNGSELPVEVSLSFYKQRNECFVIAFIVDITQRKESERRLMEQRQQLERISSDVQKLNTELENKVAERTLILREALQELERSQSDLSEALNKEKELNEIKSRFVSTASHEFRTPLSTVLSSAALLSKYVKEEEQDKRDKHIRRIKDSVHHLNDLLEDFLSLSKLEEGKVQVKPEQVLIADFLEEVVNEIKPVVKPAQHIILEPEPDMVFVTDKKLLKIILINLLSNAAKFSNENGSIWLRASLDENHLLISIRDQGIGIPNADKQHIFTSFYRGKNAVNIQGTGLGLHIVKAYVELLHGAVRLNSAAGKGTTVLLDLPALTKEKI